MFVQHKVAPQLENTGKTQSIKTYENLHWRTGTLYVLLKELTSSAAATSNTVLCLQRSNILPETCRPVSMEDLSETPYCQPHTQHTAACYWSLTLSSETPPGRTQCTTKTPTHFFLNVYQSTICVALFCTHGVDPWPFYHGPTACHSDSLSPAASVQLPPDSQMKPPPLLQSGHPGISAQKKPNKVQYYPKAAMLFTAF